MPGYDGFAALGDAIAGGPRRRAETAYPVRLKQNFDAFDALNEARISRAQANARERLSADVVTRALGGDQAALGELGATTMGMASGQPNLSTFTGGLKDLGDIELQRQQVAAAESGDTSRLNRLTAVAGDKMIEQTKISDGIAFDPLGTPDQELVVTPLGQATITQKGALGDAALERAGAAAQQSRSHAALYDTQAAAGGWKPSSGKAPATAAEQEAKIDWILAEGTRKAKAMAKESGAEAANQYAEAWINEQMSKAGLLVDPARGPQFQNVVGSSSTVPSGLGDVPTSTAVSEPLLQQAQEAISRGADPEAVRARLRKMGRSDLAGSI